MAEPLKNFLSPALVESLGDQLALAHPALDRARYVELATAGLDRLELKERSRHIARAMAATLPKDFETLAAVLEQALGPAHVQPDGWGGMAPFRYMPFSDLLAEHGLAHPHTALRVMHALTQRFTAEFCIRPFLIAHQELVLTQLDQWVTDPNVHVRRLVSEGTRTRLPWAPQLPAFIADPSPVIALLARLRDDPELYVRRSVANSLNDIGKDHPARLTQLCAEWSEGADEPRRRLIHHALRSAIKRGNADAIALRGGSAHAEVHVTGRCSPAEAVIGTSIELFAEVTNVGATQADLVVDFMIHFVKSSGGTGAKVFKGRHVTLDAGQTATVRKRVSLKQHTTRTHFAGRHTVEVQVNGLRTPISGFDLA